MCSFTVDCISSIMVTVYLGVMSCGLVDSYQLYAAFNSVQF